MQIHEITYKKINEASIGGAVGGAKSIIGGIASQLGKGLAKSAFGGTDVMGDKTGPARNRAQALQLGQQLSRTLMPVMMKNWANKVQTALAQSKDTAGNPATSLQTLQPASLNMVKAELDAMVNQAINPKSSNFDYNKLQQYVGNDPLTKSQAQVIAQAITAATDQIWKATLEGGNPAQAWQKLMTDGIAPAQGVIAYDFGAGTSQQRLYQDPTGKWVINLGKGPEWLDKNKPEHKQALDAFMAGKAT